MISLSSGDRKAISASSKANTASQSSASADEDGMRSGGRPRVATADAHSRPGRAIAATLGISLDTVKSTVSRAVAKLRIDTELGEDAGA